MCNRCHLPRETFWLVALGVLSTWPTHCCADQAELLSLIRAGHRSARESIHSLSATVTKEITFANEPAIVLTGRYWRSLDVVRVQEKQGEGTDDYLVKDSETHQVGRGVDPKSGRIHYAACRKAATEIFCLLDVWSIMMFDFIGPNNGGRYDLDRFLELAKGSPKAKREIVNGRNCIRVNLTYVSGGEMFATIWFDVDHNYLVWKKTVTPEVNSSSYYETEILEFSEPLPGIFVPVNCRGQDFLDGKRVSLENVSLSDVQVNKPIPKNTFQLPAIPSGTILDDRIQRERYPIDSNWRRIGPASPLPHQEAEIASSDSPTPDYRSQSTTEPVPFSRWLILSSLVVLVAACSFLLCRRLRLRGRLQRPN